MANDTVITIVGNLTSDAELRFTPAGKAVANFTIASTPRSFDKASGEWKDGDALFLRCSLWGQPGENAAETLLKGTRVLAQGRLRQRSYEKDGDKRTVIELEVDEIGPSLRYATAKVARVDRGTDRPSKSPSDDPWATATPSGAADPWTPAPSEAPPPF